MSNLHGVHSVTMPRMKVPLEVNPWVVLTPVQQPLSFPVVESAPICVPVKVPEPAGEQIG